MPAEIDNLTCASLTDTYPSVQDFNAALGGGAIALYVISAIVIVVLAVQFGFLTGHFLRHVPDERKMATFWVNSVYLVVAIFTMFSIALPMASDFVWLFYRVYLGLAMGHFVFLMMNWYGGETAMIEAVGHDTLVNFRVRPCCFCFCCPNAAHLNKKRIRIMQGAVYQMPYIQGGTLFLMAVFQISGYLDNGSLNPAGPYFWCTMVLLGSFFCGVWGLFSLFEITKKNMLLVNHRFVKKALILKTILMLINVQGILIDLLANNGVVPCILPYMSAQGVGGVIQSCLSLTEAIVFGSLNFMVHIKDTSHL